MPRMRNVLYSVYLQDPLRGTEYPRREATSIVGQIRALFEFLQRALDNPLGSPDDVGRHRKHHPPKPPMARYSIRNCTGNYVARRTILIVLKIEINLTYSELCTVG
jgi:hypothetical protein